MPVFTNRGTSMSYSISSLKKNVSSSWKLNGLLGSTIITGDDSTFDSDTGFWVKKTGTTISNGIAEITALGNLGSTQANWSLHNLTTFTSGKRYKISFRVRQTTGTGNFQVFNAYAYTIFNESVTSDFVTYTVDYTALDVRLEFGGLTVNDVFELDEVTIEEILPNKMGTEVFDTNDATFGTDVADKSLFDAAYARWGIHAVPSIVSVTSNVMRLSTVGSQGIKITGMTIGVTQRIKFNITSITGTLRLQEYSGSGWVVFKNITTAGTYVLDFTPAYGGTLYFNSDGSANNVYFDASSVECSSRPILTADGTPQGNNGIVYGATQNSESMSFDGVANYIEIPSQITSYLSNSADYTISLRFLTNDTTSTKNLLSSSLSSSERMAISLSGDEIRAGHYTGTYSTKSTAFTDTSSEHHIIMIKTSGVVTAYLDSVEMSGTSQPNTTSIVNTVIGARQDISAFFDGKIKNVKIWNRALTTDEVLLDAQGAGKEGRL